MNKREPKLSIEEARQTDLVEYLSKLGYEPTKIRNNDYWYLSPLRIEKTASFKINRKLNRWYDHGIGKGGNLIDFGILYHHCSVADFLEKIGDHLSFHQALPEQKEHSAELEKGGIKILEERPITSLFLSRYLHERKISTDVAAAFCREVSYRLHDKNYVGIGFKNDSAGYEIRSPYIKCSSTPKDITTISRGASDAHVFEGFFDFLSFMTIHKNQPQISRDFVILNSVSFFEKARPFMEQHDTIRLYFDRDTTGQNYSRYALSLSNKYKDESNLYQHHKDLNDWLTNFGKAPKKSFRKGI